MHITYSDLAFPSLHWLAASKIPGVAARGCMPNSCGRITVMFKQQKKSDHCIQHQQRAQLTHTPPGTSGRQTESPAPPERIPSCFPANCPSEHIVWKPRQNPFISNTGGSPWSWTSARQLNFSFQAQAAKTYKRKELKASNWPQLKESRAVNGRMDPRLWPVTSKLSHWFSAGSCRAKMGLSN